MVFGLQGESKVPDRPDEVQQVSGGIHFFAELMLEVSRTNPTCQHVLSQRDVSHATVPSASAMHPVSCRTEWGEVMSSDKHVQCIFLMLHA